MAKEEEKTILLLIVKHGDAWNAYLQVRKEIRLLREFLNMDDEASD